MSLSLIVQNFRRTLRAHIIRHVYVYTLSCCPGVRALSQKLNIVPVHNRFGAPYITLPLNAL